MQVRERQLAGGGLDGADQVLLETSGLAPVRDAPRNEEVVDVLRVVQLSRRLEGAEGASWAWSHVLSGE